MMQAFEVAWLRWSLVMILGGLLAAVILYLGFYLPETFKGPAEGREELEEFPAGIQMARRGIPLLLVLLYVGIFLFLVIYPLYIWLGRVSY